MATFAETENLPIFSVCLAVNMSRATYYRGLKLQISKPQEMRFKKISSRCLSDTEREKIMAIMHSERFVDKAPATIVATLLDEGEYLCSTRTMYRLLAEKNEVHERRTIVRHKNYAKPELLAVCANQVWSWDITKLKGAVKWNYFYLYAVMDIFSRKVVAWGVYEKESAILAENLISVAVENEKINPDELTIHSDRGAPMKSKILSELLADLHVTKSFSRPHVRNDNPYSESTFKTLGCVDKN